MIEQQTILPPRGFGSTSRKDFWWIQPVMVFTMLFSFIIYTTWAAFQGEYYSYGNYLSPFYSPELFGASSHSWFGPQPEWWPQSLPFSPAFFVLLGPAGMRFTCYYYRGAYYKSFWADPPACSVGEPRKKYWGENKFPLIMQNAHRYFMYVAIIFVMLLAYDAWKALWFVDTTTGASSFGIGVGSLVLIMNAVLLGGYTFGCHSFRHLVGGVKSKLSSSPVQKKVYQCSSGLNKRHMNFAWFSLIWVALADVYIRLCAMGIITDLRIF